jgi:lipopolysaccharide transport system permease protein
MEFILRANEGIFKALFNLLKYRGRVFDGIFNDIHQRYIGSIFGFLWVILFPILQLGIYAGLYSFIFKIRVPGLDEIGYVLLVFSGLVPLMAFSEALTASTSSLTANKNLLLNTVFPAELIPLRSAISAHATSLVGLLITIILGFSTGRTSLGPSILIPIFWVLLLMFAIGLGWILSLLSLVARDIQYGLSLITMLLFVLSPFAYTPEMVPAGLKSIIYLNPLSYFVLTFQQIICYGVWPDLIPAIGSIVLGLGTFLIGFTVFQKARFVFFDYA